MHIRKLCLAATAAIAVSAPLLANAQLHDSDGRSSALWGWDDASADRPSSWIPYTSYGYVGLGAGRSDFELGQCSPAFSCDNRDIGYKLYTGGKFSRLFGVEAGLVYLGQGEANGGDNRATGINLSLIGNIPIGDMFNIYGKVGGIYGWTHTSSSPATGVNTGNEHGFNLSYGAGVQFDLTRNWAIAGDWDRYRFDYTNRTDDVDLYSFNVLYKF
ncbi:MAG: outer membrane beta-barrel protein [Betaproteobacteria bacterium]